MADTKNLLEAIGEIAESFNLKVLSTSDDVVSIESGMMYGLGQDILIGVEHGVLAKVPNHYVNPEKYSRGFYAAPAAYTGALLRGHSSEGELVIINLVTSDAMGPALGLVGFESMPDYERAYKYQHAWNTLTSQLRELVDPKSWFIKSLKPVPELRVF